MPDMPLSATRPPRAIPALRTWLLLAALLATLAFSFQGTRAVWSRDEGRYTENALQMIASGHYLVPAYSDTRSNFTKPPLTYWAIAVSVLAFGHNTWAVRLPNALAFILTGLLLAAMGSLLLPRRPWLPGVVYACSLGPFLAANVVSTDNLLVLCETLAMYGFVRAAFGPSPTLRRGPLRLMWLGFGLAFLTKGPPGLLPLLAALVFVARRDGRAGLRRLFAPSGLAVFAVVGLSWYLAVVLLNPGLLRYFLQFELYDRLFTAAQHRHPQWYGWLVAYAPMLLLGTLPWWPALWRSLRTLGQWPAHWRQPSPTLLLWLWVLLPLVVFCLARSRLPFYVLPLFVPLSLLLAQALAARVDLAGNGQRLALAAWVLLLVLIKGGVALFAHPHADDRARAQVLQHAVAPRAHAALVYVENTASHVAIEEDTPWGVRLYLHQPLYGIAWRRPGAAAVLCGHLRQHAPLLLASDRGIGADALQQALSGCHARALPLPGGHGRRRLWWVHASTAP